MIQPQIRSNKTEIINKVTTNKPIEKETIKPTYNIIVNPNTNNTNTNPEIIETKKPLNPMINPLIKTKNKTNTIKNPTIIKEIIDHIEKNYHTYLNYPLELHITVNDCTLNYYSFPIQSMEPLL